MLMLCRITSLDVVLQCPALQHAGLAFNHVRCLPDGSVPLAAASSLISLDLAHNDIVDLAAALAGLRRLPQLRSLSLGGNPACLLPTYEWAVREGLPALKYFDCIVRGGGGRRRVGWGMPHAFILSDLLLPFLGPSWPSSGFLNLLDVS